MSTLIAVYTTRAGQTSTYWATSLAWTLAENRHVMLIDSDMEGGTIADLLYLKIGDQSLGNCFGDRPARPDELAAQSVIVPNRPNLRIVPGLRGSYGYDIAECLRKMHLAYTGLPDDVAIARTSSSRRSSWMTAAGSPPLAWMTLDAMTWATSRTSGGMLGHELIATPSFPGGGPGDGP